MAGLVISPLVYSHGHFHCLETLSPCSLSISIFLCTFSVTYKLSKVVSALPIWQCNTGAWRRQVVYSRSQTGGWWRRDLSPGLSGPESSFCQCPWGCIVQMPLFCIWQSTRAELIHELMAPTSLQPLPDGLTGSSTPNITGQRPNREQESWVEDRVSGRESRGWWEHLSIHHQSQFTLGSHFWTKFPSENLSSTTAVPLSNTS